MGRGHRLIFNETTRPAIRCKSALRCGLSAAIRHAMQSAIFNERFLLRSRNYFIYAIGLLEFRFPIENYFLNCFSLMKSNKNQALRKFRLPQSVPFPRPTHPYPLSRGEFILHTVWFHSPYFEYIYNAQKMGIFSRFL